MTSIYHSGVLSGIHFSLPQKGSRAVTDHSLPLQVLTMACPAKKMVAQHFHTPHKRITRSLGECLFVFDGLARVSLFNTRGRKYKTIMVKSGEGFILFSGGHEIEFLKKTRAVEFKNGPFIEDKVSL